jgi:hypothetical protein
MMWKPQLEAARRWHRIFGEELDSLHDISLGAITNLRAIRNRYYRAMVGHLELLRIIDAARWGEGLSLWHQEGASSASEVTWQGKEPELRELLSRSPAEIVTAYDSYPVSNDYWFVVLYQFQKNKYRE